MVFDRDCLPDPLFSVSRCCPSALLTGRLFVPVAFVFCEPPAGDDDVIVTGKGGDLEGYPRVVVSMLE